MQTVIEAEHLAMDSWIQHFVTRLCPLHLIAKLTCYTIITVGHVHSKM